MKLFFSTLILILAVDDLTRLYAQETPLSRRQFQAILDSLDSPFTKNPERNEAAAKLRDLGTNALPFLLEELKAVGRIEETNVLAATNRKVKVQTAFEVLGSRARPLVPELVAELNAGRSLGNAPHALAQIGGLEAGLALVQAITNANARIRASGASAVQYFKENREIAQAAVPALLLLLSDNSGPLRSMAANSLGTLKAESEQVIPALLRMAESDSDSVVRAAAVKSIANFRTDAAEVQARLEKIADSDKDEYVRRIAAQALRQR